MRRTVALALVLTAVLLAPSAAVALPLLSHHGRWITDPQGRVVVVHGLQVDRYMPDAPIEYIDLNPQNVELMRREGFNAARVSFAYAGYEPSPGAFQQSYLDSYLAFDRTLAGKDVYDLLDMMQGQYSAMVNGWGFPDWMTVTDGAPNTRLPFPQGYLGNPAVNRAFDNLYADTRAADAIGLQEHYARGLRRIAAAFAGAPGLLGVEILNEPWAGSLAATCFPPAGCPPGGFDQTALTAFSKRMVAAVRAADPSHPIAVEPNLLFDYGAATHLGDMDDPNVIFAFHPYCAANLTTPNNQPSATCAPQERMVLSNAEAYSKATRAGLLMDEWGNTTDTTAITRLADEADAAMVGWMNWALEDCCNSAAAVVIDGSKPPTPDNVRTPLLDALVRPYPRAIAGTPTAWHYDAAARTFTLSFRPTLLNGHPAARMASEVFIPRRHYPTGYAVTVSGASVGATTAGLLTLCNSAGARRVTLTVVPAKDSFTDLPGPAGRASCRGGDSTAVSGAPSTVRGAGSVVVVPATATVSAPRTRRCTGRRVIAIHARLRRAVTLLGASATLDRRPLVVRRAGRLLTVRADLRGRTGGAHRVRIVLRLRRGTQRTTVSIVRVYRACR